MERIPRTLKRFFAKLDQHFQTRGDVIGVIGAATGVPSLDLVDGLCPGEVLVLAGEPGSGKTALAISMGLTAARAATDVLYLALSETADAIGARLLLHDSGVASRNIRSASLTSGERERLAEAVNRLRALPFSIEDRGHVSVTSLREIVRRWKTCTTGRNAMVIVDYVQLLGADRDTTNRGDDATTIRLLANMAKEANASVVIVSQLGARDVDDDRPPQLVDIPASAMLACAATAVLIMHRPPGRDVHELILAKHRRSQPALDTCRIDASTGALHHVHSTDPQ